ncbi:MAG TPA: hypothetical protein VJY62_22470 [Bacteroidia bacterium]|nr:hypothetical protein [Bacteroidia bacterium]
MNNMNPVIFLAGFLIISGLSSCDHLYTYTYTLSNHADTTITVHLKANNLDTIYAVPNNETKLLYVVTHLGDAHGPDFINVSEDLKTFLVTKKNVASHRDYLKNETWNFEKGDYKTDVTNDEF